MRGSFALHQGVRSRRRLKGTSGDGTLLQTDLECKAKTEGVKQIQGRKEVS